MDKSCSVKIGEAEIKLTGKAIKSLSDGAGEYLSGAETPLCTVRLRGADGAAHEFDSREATRSAFSERARGLALTLDGFPFDVTVKLALKEVGGAAEWRVKVENRTDMLVEWVEFPGVSLRRDGASALYPINEGGIVEDFDEKQHGPCPYASPEYPSKGNYGIFPNMVCSQFVAYMAGGRGLYMGLHDAARGLKGIGFLPEDDGVRFYLRLYQNCSYGEDFAPDYPVVWKFFEGDWMDAADIYREWFDANPVPDMVKITDNGALPAWYAESPVVVTYPVRGQHDMDKMDPNGLFPLVNALPYVDSFADKLASELLVLLMHWEGTAPWAPPYVWPPYGGEDGYRAFMDALHERGHKLGVYCSGLGWTSKSNLVDYCRDEEFDEKGYSEAMCLAPDGSLPKSKICTGQRSGYDICPASEKGKAIMEDALTPLLTSGTDYVQSMDQNHGGNSYFCYSKEHGHRPAPGPWMIDTMREMLKGWDAKRPGILLGCESAAAEPFIPYLGLSDNRYELNYSGGRAVPLYAYLYHEYVNNFMGNQVCANFPQDTEGLCYRLAYSFAAGDLLTLVIDDKGRVMPRWGMRDFSVLPDGETALRFTAALNKARRDFPEFLHTGRMTRGKSYICKSQRTIALNGASPLHTDSVLSSAWTSGGRTAQFFANFTDADAEIMFESGEKLMVGAYSVAHIEY